MAFKQLILTTRPTKGDKSVYKHFLDYYATRKKKLQKDGPYILFGIVKPIRKSKDDDSVLWTPQIHKLPIGGMHSVQNDVDRYLQTGWVILDYWVPDADNIQMPPIQDGVQTVSGWQLTMSSNTGRQDVQKIIRYIKSKMISGEALEAQNVKQKNEIEELKAKLADAQAKLAKEDKPEQVQMSAAKRGEK